MSKNSPTKVLPFRKPRGKAPKWSPEEIEEFASRPALDLTDALVESIGGLARELYYAKPYEPPDDAATEPQIPNP